MKENHIIVDEEGREFPGLSDAYRFHNIKWMPNGKTYRALKKHGIIRREMHSFRIKGAEVAQSTTQPIKRTENAKEGAIIAKLKARYSEEEIQCILNGEGIAKKEVKSSKIVLGGRHHRMVVLSDTHIGSIYTNYSWHDVVAEYVNNPKNKVECILHCGDVVEGLKTSRAGTHIYELSELGFDKQKEKAIEIFSRYNIPIYAISGNHDAFYRDFAGANIVQSICEELPNMHYLGHDCADIEIDGCKIRLFHGSDGNSYALSYRSQKILESFDEGNKPNILIAGHTHKFCYIYNMERRIYGINAPCMQSTSSWMRSKKISAHTGFLILDFDARKGEVSNLSVKYIPFYDE